MRDKVKMVLQYKSKKGGSWRDYNGKDNLRKSISNYWFRLLSKNRKKVLAEKNSYNKVMKLFRQIEAAKHG